MIFVMDGDCGKRLKELPDAILIIVFWELVVRVQGWATPFTKQDVAPLKVISATICGLV